MKGAFIKNVFIDELFNFMFGQAMLRLLEYMGDYGKITAVNF